MCEKAFLRIKWKAELLPNNPSIQLHKHVKVLNSTDRQNHGQKLSNTHEHRETFAMVLQSVRNSSNQKTKQSKNILSCKMTKNVVFFKWPTL